MARTLKLNFTVPADLAEELRTRVDKRKRSAFVVQAVRHSLAELRMEQLRRELAEGYQARYEEDAATNAEWEGATLEKWE